MDSYECICSGQTKNDDGPDNTASSLSGVSDEGQLEGPIVCQIPLSVSSVSGK